jgi:hypothetical protein
VSSPQRKALVNAYAVGLDPNPLAGIESALKRCTVPTRIVWGMGDTIFSPASPDYLDRTLPHSLGVRRIEGAKLFFPEEFPDVIAAEALRLWGRAWPQAGGANTRPAVQRPRDTGPSYVPINAVTAVLRRLPLRLRVPSG